MFFASTRLIDIGYDCSYTPLLMSYPTEIFPYSIRSKGLTCELLSIYCSLVIAAFVNPIGLQNLGWRYYIVFCCLLVGLWLLSQKLADMLQVVFLAITYFFFPETRGHSLEEIAEIFDGPKARPEALEIESGLGKLSKVSCDEHVEERIDKASV